MKTLTSKDDWAALSRTQRWYLRKKGIDVPKLSPGPQKGYKQSCEHIEKRKRYGFEHHSWKGENIEQKSGRSRALRKYTYEDCEVCGDKGERHHKDRNTKNNEPDNIRYLCRRCHMIEDGRMDGFKELARINQPKAVAARWN